MNTREMVLYERTITYKPSHPYLERHSLFSCSLTATGTHPHTESSDLAHKKQNHPSRGKVGTSSALMYGPYLLKGRAPQSLTHPEAGTPPPAAPSTLPPHKVGRMPECMHRPSNPSEDWDKTTRGRGAAPTHPIFHTTHAILSSSLHSSSPRIAIMSCSSL
jgi:hypothetical protein